MRHRFRARSTRTARLSENPTTAAARRRCRGSPRDQLGRRGQQRHDGTPVTPFNVFVNSRGGQFTTPGTGLSQAPPSGGPQGGLAALFNNPTYANIFQTFSPPRLFTPVGSRITEGFFFVPGTNGATPATVTGFGAVFTDVDKPNGSRAGKDSTLIDYFDADGRRSSGSRPVLAGRWRACPSSESCSTTAHRPGEDHDRRLRPGAG